MVPVAAFLPQGDEFLPVLARGSERETGYSRVNERLLNPRVSGLLRGGGGGAPSEQEHSTGGDREVSWAQWHLGTKEWEESGCFGHPGGGVKA